MATLVKTRACEAAGGGMQKGSAPTTASWGLLRRLGPAPALIMTIALATASASYGATITVGTTNDTSGMGGCSLRDAITTANGTNVTGSGCPSPSTDPSNIINFAVTGTIKLGSTLPSISGNLTITGPITIDGQSTVQPLQVNRTATVDLQFLTLANGNVNTGNGGAISNQGTLTVSNCTFSTNQATGANASGGGEGGAIFNAGTLTVTNSTFSSNKGNGGDGGSNDNGNGGAIFSTSTLTVTNSTFLDNQGNGGIGGSGNKGNGGAISSSGTLSITNSTFSGNQANGGSGGSGANIGNGGAVFNTGTATVASSTFSGNQAGQGGAIFSSGTVGVKGTILAASTPGNCGGVTDDGYNIADDTSCNFPNGSTSLVLMTSDIGLDPAGPADNGGPTETIALQSGSHAIDVIPQTACTDANGDPLTTDQRGKARPDGGEDVCDVGAYEFQESFVGSPAR